MAKLRDDSTSEVRAVPARMLVGRSATCFLRLSDAQVSGEHALVQWTGQGWVLRDLGSRNGTHLNGRRLPVAASSPLARGSQIAFGDPKATFTMQDAGPPVPMALELRSRQMRESQAGLLALPNTDEPQAVVYQRDDGTWVQEAADETQGIADQELLYLDQQVWCVFLPDEAGVTPVVCAEKTLAATAFEFEVSRDEEHVVMTVVHGDERIALEPREHHYVLLVLARARAKDAALPPPERGWLSKDKLQQMLRIRPSALNVAVHRARQQLADAGVVGAAGLVEVRRGLRRFGTDRFTERPLGTPA